MKILGVTGGIGSGKSTLCKVLVEHAAAALYDADSRAKALMTSDEELRQNLIKGFGEECYCQEGLNRSHLSRVAFSCEESLSKLNAIVHPRVRADFQKWLSECHAPIAILESAILFESNFDDMVDIKIAVLAPLPLRIERVAKRDNLSHEDITRRINAQLSDDELEKRADICIVNIFEDDLEGSAQRVVQLVEQWGR